MTPHVPDPRSAARRVLISEELADVWATRTAEGRRLSFVWGEPDADGFYTPTFTETEDEWFLDTIRLRAERDRLREALEQIAEDSGPAARLGAGGPVR